MQSRKRWAARRRPRHGDRRSSCGRDGARERLRRPLLRRRPQRRRPPAHRRSADRHSKLAPAPAGPPERVPIRTDHRQPEVSGAVRASHRGGSAGGVPAPADVEDPPDGAGRSTPRDGFVRTRGRPVNSTGAPGSAPAPTVGCAAIRGSWEARWWEQLRGVMSVRAGNRRGAIPVVSGARTSWQHA